MEVTLVCAYAGSCTPQAEDVYPARDIDVWYGACRGRWCGDVCNQGVVLCRQSETCVEEPPVHDRKRIPPVLA